MEQEILSTIIQFAACVFLLFAVLLWVRREKNLSRVYFSVVYFVCGIDLFLRVVRIYNGSPFVFEALQPGDLYMALIEIPLFSFYLIEVVNPGWLTWRKIGLLCMPWLLWNVCMLIPGLHFRELDTFRDIFRHIGEPNVWLRLLFVLLILPYNLLIYSVPYNWRRSSADRNLIRIYGAGFILTALFFISSSVSGSMLVSSLHLSYGMIFCFYIAYNEIFLRLGVPRSKMDGVKEVKSESLQPILFVPTAPATAGDETEPKEADTDQTAPDNELWPMLTALVSNGKLWRNPDLDQIEFVNLLGTNRTTLSLLFKENGYAGGYREYINRHRIADFIEIMKQHPQKNILDVFFDVGYRSKATAYRNFKEYVGEAPFEYFTKQSEDI